MQGKQYRLGETSDPNNGDVNPLTAGRRPPGSRAISLTTLLVDFSRQFFHEQSFGNWALSITTATSKTAEATAEAAEQEDDKNDNEDESERHDRISVCRTSVLDRRPAPYGTDLI